MVFKSDCSLHKIRQYYFGDERRGHFGVGGVAIRRLSRPFFSFSSSYKSARYLIPRAVYVQPLDHDGKKDNKIILYVTFY